MKKKFVVSILVIIEIISIIIIFGKDNNDTLSLINKKEETNNMFAIMVSDDGTNWTEHDGTGFPEGKKFDHAECYDANERLINETITYDELNKKVTSTLNGTAYCYLYFVDIDNSDDPIFAIYSKSEEALRFYQNSDYENGKVNVEEEYNDHEVTEIYVDLKDTNFETIQDVLWFDIRNNIEKVYIVDIISPNNTAYWFANMNNLKYADVTNLNALKITTMQGMFGNDCVSDFKCNEMEEYKIIGLNDLKIDNVTDMSSMFYGAGAEAKVFDIGDLSNWNTSKVTDMSYMFYNSAQYGELENFNIGNLSNWDTSQVTDMSRMFEGAGAFSNNYNIGDLSTWNTSKVTNMSGMLAGVGGDDEEVNIGNLSTKEVTKNGITYTAWDTAKVEDMSYMFASLGYKAKKIELNLSNWNVSNVKNMEFMFGALGYEQATDVEINFLNWDVPNVTNMYEMFFQTGYHSSNLELSGIENWRPLNVENVSEMFYETGYSNANFKLDLSDWDLSETIKCTYERFKQFDYNVALKIIDPDFGCPDPDDPCYDGTCDIHPCILDPDLPECGNGDVNDGYVDPGEDPREEIDVIRPSDFPEIE